MNDTTKPAAQAVASSHKVPSKYEVDTLGDELANLEMKLSKIRRKAILSAGEARRDQLELEEIEKATTAKADEFRAMVDNYTLPPKTVEIPAALEAVRERMATAGVLTDAQKDQIDGTTRQAPEAAKAVEAISAALDKPGEGGKVSLGKAYLVGEKGAEMIVPAATARELMGATFVEAGFFQVRTGDKVENAKPGDVELDEGDPEIAKRVQAEIDTKARDERILSVSVHRGRMPPSDPQQGTRWAFPDHDCELVFDQISGWTQEIHDQPGTFRQVDAGELTSDYWEQGELRDAMRKGVKKTSLFSLGKR